MRYSSDTTLIIPVGARSSRLSQVQVQEVLKELQQHYPSIQFKIHLFLTTGDQNQHLSLRDLDRTNFFTKEIDTCILNGHCRLGIHSAKDLPDPLPQGLALICVTKGLDPSDALVLREGEMLESLPIGAVIATSSLRREEAVRQLRSDFVFKDIRGTIEQRLAKLENWQADGIVIAEAALIRLHLTHLNRIRLKGETATGQGQLAIIAREDDQEMKHLFACINRC